MQKECYVKLPDPAYQYYHVICGSAKSLIRDFLKLLVCNDACMYVCNMYILCESRTFCKTETQVADLVLQPVWDLASTP